MLWTTPDLDAAVEELRALPAEERERDVLNEDVTRISPLKHANLNVLGRYTFTASTRFGGGLRRLRDPDPPELDQDGDGIFAQVRQRDAAPVLVDAGGEFTGALFVASEVNWRCSSARATCLRNSPS